MRHIVLWLGCLGGLLATSRIRHLSIDMFSRLLPPRLQGIRDRVIYLATAVATSVLGMAALRLVIDEKSFGEEAFLGVQVWVVQLILPVTFFLITYRSLLNFFLARKAEQIDWTEISAEDEGDARP
jgi:TRAP-type C4-dicarboxylate transport system permease small subunit